MKTVYLLVGPKGSGKTHIGKILADAFAIRFIESEAIFATLQKEGITTDENQQRGFDILEKNIEQALSEHKSVCFEITVFTPYSSKLVNNLRNKYAVEKIRVFAPNEVCLSRIRSRQSDRHINILEDKIIEINRLSNAQELDAKLMIINNNLTAADIQTLFSNTFLKSGWGFSPD
ncbi:MAG: AAA family ATPase [Calditrichia bacterium]|nr:AAA family ATPase [Calditrichota bacterium]MCB0268592.1 AAA family ATPase [Calditrichota bacterium]MCB9070550.1 AAA family ATPase [Calditrichia bacterium]